MSDKKLPKYSWLNFTEKKSKKNSKKLEFHTPVKICDHLLWQKCVIKFLRYLPTFKINLVIASGKLLVSILSKSMFRTHKYLKKYFVSIRYLNRFQKLKNPTDYEVQPMMPMKKLQIPRKCLC